MNVAEGHGRPVGKTQGKNGGRNIGTEWHNSRIPADLNIGFEQLLGHRSVIVTGGQKNVKTASLVFLDNHFGDFGIRCSPYNGGKARCGTVHKLDPPFTKNGIIGGPQPDFSGFFVDIFGVQIKFRLVQVAQRLSDLKREKRGHTGIQQRPQIRQMVHALDVGRQKLAAHIQHLLHVFQRFDFNSQQRVNHRQIVGGVGKSHLRICVEGIQCFLIFAFNLRHNVITTLNSGKCN